MNEQRQRWDEEVKGPGKFEGESAYVPYYWNIFLDSGAEECDDSANTIRIPITKEDRALFPELSDREDVFLIETDSGFVCEVDGPAEDADYDDDDDIDEAVRLSSSLSSLDDDDEDVGELQPGEGDETTRTYLGFYRPWNIED